MNVRPLWQHLEIMYKTIIFVLLVMADRTEAVAQNYIHYHQKSLVVQEYMAQGDTAKALALLAKLEKRYPLLPTETFARATCLVAEGDTAAARRSYMKFIEQHGVFGWLDIGAPPFRTAADSLWYQGVFNEGLAYHKVHPDIVDGLTGTIPTVVTWTNRAHQNLLDSLNNLGTGDSADSLTQALYDAFRLSHDATLDSMIAGELPVFSIQANGTSTEFQDYILHVSPAHMVACQKYLKRWLKQGLIYPEDYAASIDGPAYRLSLPMTYKFMRYSDDHGVKSGYEKRRWKIGMGTDRLNRLRFHRFHSGE